MGQVKKFSIDRTKWARGYNSFSENFLWDSNTQKGCCLGHVIKQLEECEWSELDELTTPVRFYTEPTRNILVDDVVSVNMNQNNSLTHHAMEINDGQGYTDEEREEKLIEAFKDKGLKLEFYN